MRMSKPATALRREIICNIIHEWNAFGVDAVESLSEIFRVSKSTIRTIHKNYCWDIWEKKNERTTVHPKVEESI